MAKSKGMSLSNMFVWLLLGLLIIGLAGFGATSFGAGGSAVAKVGDREIDANRYFRAANDTFRNLQAQGLQISSSSPEGQQVLDQVRSQLIRDAALENETMTLGISVGDEVVAERVEAVPGFRGIDGSFDRAAYQAALRNVGMSIPEFEDSIRIETARNILLASVTSGLTVPDAYVDALISYFGETRDARLVRFTRNDLSPDRPAPSEAELRAFYDENPDLFTLPARRGLSYVWLTPDMLLDDVVVSDEDLKALYEQRSAEFQQPERRMVERLVFEDMDAAEAAMARLTSGEATFETLVGERGLELSDIDLGEVTKDSLGAAGDVVFALTDNGVAGPAESTLGPALFRVNAILDPINIDFEAARPALRTELALERARRQIDGQYTEIEDILASGATLEEVARDTQMELGQIEWWPDITEGIAGYDSFRQAAATVTLDSFPETLQLEDGGLFALRYDAELEPTLQPYEDVMDTVEARWTDAEDARELQELARSALAQLEVGGTLEATGKSVESYPGLGRDGFVPGAAPILTERLFEMEPGAQEIVDGLGSVFLVVLDAVNAADMEADNVAQLQQALAAQVNQSVANDLGALYARAITLDAGISYNQGVLNAINAELP
ncbi:MAG: SurA N-terminal domain-containing protein [Oceanicola sp.]|nr:SurA N-terminal domain-containing protein [Oceanicola sp.]